MHHENKAICTASKFPRILYFPRVCVCVWQDNCRSSVKRECLSRCCSRETGSGDVGSQPEAAFSSTFSAVLCFYKCRFACCSLSYLMTRDYPFPFQSSILFFISVVNKKSRPFLINMWSNYHTNWGKEKKKKEQWIIDGRSRRWSRITSNFRIIMRRNN